MILRLWIRIRTSPEFLQSRNPSDHHSNTGDEAYSGAESQASSPPSSPALFARGTKTITITCPAQIGDMIRELDQEGYFHLDRAIWLHEELEMTLRDAGIIKPEMLDDAKDVNHTGDELVLPKIAHLQIRG